MIGPRLAVDIEGLGQGLADSKPEIPGYVTTERCEANVAAKELRMIWWAGGAAVAGMVLGAVLTVAISAGTKA